VVLQRLKLKMEGRHVVDEPGLDELVRISADVAAVLRCAAEKVSNGPQGLQEVFRTPWSALDVPAGQSLQGFRP
jgi:hypothetical protein